MKKLLISLALFPLLWSCAKEDGFDYQRGEISPDQITRVELYVGTDRMVADGHAKLQFIVEAFREAQQTDTNGDPVTVEVPVELSTLPEGSLGIYRENDSGDVAVGPDTYSTDDASPGSATFYARIGDVVSPVRTVALRPAPELPDKRYVDVIFHVMELDPADPTYNELSYMSVDHSLLVESINNLNSIVNNVVGGNPNAGSANVEFRMAAHDPDGKPLDTPGCQRIPYIASSLYYAGIAATGSGANATAAHTNFMDGLTRNSTNATVQGASKLWDPDRYLNIVVTRMMTSYVTGATASKEPPFQVVPVNGTPLKFTTASLGVVKTLPLSEADNKTAYSAANACILTPLNSFWPGFNRPVSIVNYIMKYYGVIATRVHFDARVPYSNDFCEDTQRFMDVNAADMTRANAKAIVTSAKKPTGEKCYTNNATDNVAYPSLRNNITLDQATRFRYVMANCPGRQNGLTE